ncbi:CASP-like protein 1E1 [Carex rostrata]
MEHNQQPPVTSEPPPYMQQQGEQATQAPPVTAPPPYTQQQRGQVNVITTPVSLEEMIGYIARGAALLTTFLATVIIGTSNQTKGKFLLESTAKFSRFSAFKYFLAANIIVLIYSIASLLISIIVKPKPLIITLSIAFVDIVAVSLLLTANGAASAISRQLDDVDHLLESSLCSYYDTFCSHIKASIAMSMLASGIYLGLIVLALVIFANKKS